MMDNKYILCFKDVQQTLGGLGRDKTYQLLKKAYKTGKPFPVISNNPYRVAKEPFLEALNKGLIKV